MDAGEWARQFAAKRRRTAAPAAEGAAAAATPRPQPPPQPALAPPSLVPLHTVCTPPPGSAVTAAPVASRGAKPTAAPGAPAVGVEALDDNDAVGGDEGAAAGDAAVVYDPAAALPVALPGGVAARARAVNAQVGRELAAVARAVAAKQHRAASAAGAAALPPSSSPPPLPPYEYRFFDRQADAYAHADALTLTWQDPAAAPFKVFSVETGGRDGKRRFIVAHAAAFWRAYAAAGRGGRHAYELLREDTPLHLYFDVEFKREAVAVAAPTAPPVAADGEQGDPQAPPPLPLTRTTNADVDGDALVALLLHRTAAALHADYGLPLTAADVVHLESSTPAKFSRHLVLRVTEPDPAVGSGPLSSASGVAAAHPAPPARRRHALFRDTAHAGAFVGRLVAALQAERAADPAVDALWVETTKGLGAQFAPTSSAVAAATAAADAGGDADAVTPPPPPAALPREFVADLGVYTRNRAMRMYLSSKRGKGVPLMPAAANAHLVPPPSAVATDSGGGGSDPLTLDYWLRACGRPLVSAPQQQVPSSSSSSSPLVQVGCAEWERAMWEASLITGTLPPLWMCRRLAEGGGGGSGDSSGGDGGRSDTATWDPLPPPVPPPASLPRTPLDAQIASLAAEYERSRQHAAYRPERHPLTGDRLLYALPLPTQQHQHHLPAPGSDGDAAVVAALVHAASVSSAASGATAHSSRPGEPPTRLVVGGSSPPPFPALTAWVCRLASGPVPLDAFEQGGGSAAATPMPPSALLPPVGRWLAAGGGVDVDAAALTRPAAARIRGWNAQAVDLLVQLPPPPDRAAAAAASGVDTAPALLPPPSVQQAAVVLTSVTYEIGGSRWCNRLGRQHRSNHVAWRVDLPTGRAWQTCWDTDCRAARYRSPPVSVPAEVLPSQLPPGAVVLPQPTASRPPAPAATAAAAATSSAVPSSATTGSSSSTSSATARSGAGWDALLTDEELLALEL
jgi:hypothetical protein